MAQPNNTSTGTVIVPVADFYEWVYATILKPTPGTFVSWGKVKVKGAHSEELEVSYSTSNTSPPTPPAT
jgi:hypothetical protein